MGDTSPRACVRSCHATVEGGGICIMYVLASPCTYMDPSETRRGQAARPDDDEQGRGANGGREHENEPRAEGWGSLWISTPPRARAIRGGRGGVSRRHADDDDDGHDDERRTSSEKQLPAARESRSAAGGQQIRGAGGVLDGDS